MRFMYVLETICVVVGVIFSLGLYFPFGKLKGLEYFKDVNEVYLQLRLAEVINMFTATFTLTNYILYKGYFNGRSCWLYPVVLHLVALGIILTSRLFYFLFNSKEYKYFVEAEKCIRVIRKIDAASEYKDNDALSRIKNKYGYDNYYKLRRDKMNRMFDLLEKIENC